MRLFAYKGYLIGLLASVLFLGFFALADFQHLRTPGHNNTGHETLVCIECHEESKGSIRQQIQANLSYLIGTRPDVVTFNFSTPDNYDCLACHDRDNDNHPIYRFNEPRFLEARKAIQPQLCQSCHIEHSGVRVTSSPENCELCHQELNVKDDPLETTHLELIKDEQWDSCLRCHDFHGNHDMKTPSQTNKMLELQSIEAYFNGGADPYSAKKLNKAKETRYEN